MARRGGAVRIHGERARKRRTSQLAAGERRELTIEVIVAEAEPAGRSAMRSRWSSPGVLEADCARVPPEVTVVGTVGHLALEPAHIRLDRQQVASTGKDVLP